MTQNRYKGMDVHDGVASFEVHVPSVAEPQLIKRVSDLRRQIILLGRADDAAALADLRCVKPDLPLRLPRPLVHVFRTNQPHKVIVVVGPAAVLKNEEIVASYAARPMNYVQARGPRFVLEVETLHELHVITGLPGTGRRNEITERLRRSESMCGPDQLAIIKTCTTRRPRALTDTLYYDFMSTEKFAAKVARKEMLQVVSYGAVSYGIDRRAALEVLEQRDGICLQVETRVDELMRLGFPIFMTEMKVTPEIDLHNLALPTDRVIN